MSGNPQNIRLSACRVRWGGRDLGLTKGGVDVTLKTDTKQVQVDQFGNTPVNEYVLGRGITVKVPLAETDLDTLYAVMKQSGVTMTDNGVKAAGTVTYSTQPAANDTITVNGHKFTFVATSPVGVDQVLIGATLGATLASLAAVLQASTDANVLAATYTASSTALSVSYYKSGVVGNSFTLAVTGTAATVSGATLTGGVDPTANRSVTVTSAVGTSLYTNALPLVLHPADKADNDSSEDLVVPLAGQSGNITYSYKIDNERVYMIEFTGYPNPSTKEICHFGQ